MTMNNAIKQYQQVDTQTKVESADPHQVINLLMQGAIDRIEQTKGFIREKCWNEKSTTINKTIDIINGLRASLNIESGEEIAQQLEQLYDFMVRHLVVANQKNCISTLEEVESLMKTIKSGWEQIPLDVRQQYQSEIQTQQE